MAIPKNVFLAIDSSAQSLPIQSYEFAHIRGISQFPIAALILRIARERGCCESRARLPAICFKRLSSPRRHSRDSRVSSPVVKVPVLSRATTLMLASVSTAAPPRNKTATTRSRSYRGKDRRRHRKHEGAWGGDNQESHCPIEGADSPVLLEKGRKVKGKSHQTKNITVQSVRIVHV